MEKLKSFLWFTGKVFLAVLLVEVVDAKTGWITGIKDSVKNITTR